MMSRRFWKITGIVALSAVLLLAAAVLLTQTAWFRDWLREYAEDKAAQYLDAELRITNLEGNLFREVRLSGIALTHRGEPVLTLDTVKLGWNPWRLLEGDIHIDSLVIDSLHGFVVQNQDSSWNVTRLVRLDTLVPEPAPTDTSAAPTLILRDLVVRRSAITLTALDTALPGEFTHIGMQLSALNDDTLRDISLKRFTVDVPDLPLSIRQLSLDAWQRKDSFALENLEIATLRNRLDATGIYREADSSRLVGSLESQPVDFTEFNMILPGISLHGNPRLTLTAQYIRDTLEVNLGVVEHEQRADIVLTLGKLSRLLKSRASDDIAYGLTANVENLDLASWVGDTSHAYILNGNIVANGSGVTPASAQVVLAADFHQSILQGYPVDSFHVSGNYRGGDALFNLFASGDFGRVTVDGDAVDLDSNGAYSARLATADFDLAAFVGEDSLSSSLNVIARIQGARLDRDLSGTAEVDISQSRVNDIAIDTLFFRGSYTARGLTIDQFESTTNLGTLTLTGGIGTDSTAAIQYAFFLDDIAPVGQLFGHDSLGGRIEINGAVAGSFDSLRVDGEYAMENFRFGVYSVQNTNGSFAVNLADSIPSGSVDMRIAEIAWDGFAIDSVLLKGESDGRNAKAEVHVQYGDSISADVEAAALLGDVTDIQLSRIAADINGYSWVGGSDSTRVIIQDSSYTVRNLLLTSDAQTDEPQRIALDGTVNLAGASDITLTMTAFQIASMLRAIQSEATFVGGLSGNVTLRGTSAAPLLDAHLHLDGAASGDYKIEQAAVDLTYADSRLVITAAMRPNEQSSLALNGTLPVALAFDHTGDRLLGDRPAEFHLVVKEFPLKAFAEFSTQLVPVDGTLGGELHMANTMNDPDLSGSLAVTKGAFDLPALDIRYTDFEMRLSADNTTLRLDSLSAKRTGGSMSAKGHLRFDQGLFTGRIAAVEFGMRSDGLELAKHKDFQIALSGDATLKGSSDEAIFGGRIVVQRSYVYLPFLMEQAMPASSIDESQPPMLVAATAPFDTTVLPPGVKPPDTADDGMLAQSDFYRNLRGTMRFSIPKNSWLRSPDMNIEISGDLDLVKQGDDFELFGPVTVLRGHYSLYGKRFIISEGMLRFTGGADYDPELNIVAEYTFRSADRESRALEAMVTGTAKRPLVAFTLDGLEIEERDAVAYVMFGRSMDELTSGGSGGLTGESEELAKGTAANILAGELAQTLGSGLGLDVIDIEAQDSFSAATITVGKYLTNNLFVSYQRGVGEFKDNDVTPAFVTLEYEVARFLVMQLSQGDPKTNGFDFIFRTSSR